MRYLFSMLFIISSLFASDISKKVTVAIDPEYAPLTYKSFQGQAEGLIVEFWKEWSKQSGYEVEFKFFANWDEGLEAVKNGDVVFHSGSSLDDDWMVGSQELYKLNTVYYKIKDTKLDNNVIIGSIDQYYATLAKIKFPNAKIVMYNEYTPMLKDIMAGKIDLFIDDEVAVDYFLLQNGVKVKFDKLKDKYTTNVYALTNKKNKKYIEIFNKYFQRIDKSKLLSLEKNILNTSTGYFSTIFEKHKFLTAKELMWIKSHTISVGVEQWQPVIYTNTGHDIDGICGDFTKKIVESTGLKIDVVTGKWDVLLRDFKDNKIDLLPATYHTNERAKFGLYSDGYFKMKDSLYVKTSNNNINSLEDLNGKTLAIIKGYGTITKLQNKFPKIKLVFTNDLDDSINRVLNGRVDAFFEGEVAANTKIRNELIKGLKSVPVVSFKAPSLHYFSTMKEPILNSIIQKALKHISYQQRTKILSNWIVENKKIQKNTNMSISDILPIKESLSILFVFLLIIYILFKYLKKKENISLNSFIPIIVSIFLIFAVLITVLAVRNLETVQKREVESLLKAMVQVTNEALLEWFSSQQFSSAYIVNNSSLLNDIKILEEHRYDMKYLKSHQVMLDKYAKKMHQNFRNKRTYFIVSKDYIVLGSSDKSMIGKKVKNTYILSAINKALLKGYSYLMPFKNAKNDKLYYNQYIMTAWNDNVTNEPIAIYATGMKPKTMLDIAKKGRAGQSGETYFVNKKAQFISHSRFKNNSFLNIDLKYNGEYTKAVKVALLKNNGVDVNGYLDYRGVSVFGSWVYNEELDLIIISEIDKNEAMNSFKNLKITVYSVVISIVLFTILLMVFIVWYANKNKKVLEKNNKELEDLSINLEIKVQDKTKDLSKQNEFIQALLDSQEQIILTTDGDIIKSVNETFLEFFKVSSIKNFQEVYDAQCVCKTFNEEASQEYLKTIMNGESWIDYVISKGPDLNHKVIITIDDVDFTFSVTGTNLPGNNNLKLAVFTDITEMEKAKLEVEAINKHTKESIEYASLIQGALIPNNNIFRKYFKEYFAIWHPKDLVGGDIYLFEELRSDDECLLMVIDCTGHGVPGAFVTMLVKAIERQLTAKINHSDEDVSPAKILSIFNRSMKHLLKQEDADSVSNAGFDGGIIYYNKKDSIIKYAGAETPLFYTRDNELKMIKGDRYSVGYKKCDANYEYKEHIIEVKEGMNFYLTTDGYLDQNGGKKGFCFGKRRFKSLIEEYHMETMADQQEVFLNELSEYQDDYETNDDITLIGLKI